MGQKIFLITFGSLLSEKKHVITKSCSAPSSAEKVFPIKIRE